MPKNMAIQNPTCEELMAAVESLGLAATMQPTKAYPGSWWNHEGCVSVEKSLVKTDLIGKVGSKLKQIRGTEPPKKDSDA